MRIPGVQGDVQNLPLVARIVTALQGRPVANKAPTKGQSLVWNGSQWAPQNVPSGNVTFTGARITASSTQSIANSTNTDLNYQSVLFDTDSMANLAGDARKLTVNTAGLYLVVCETAFAFSSGSAGRRINVIVYNDFYSSGGSIPVASQSSDTRNAVWSGAAQTPYTTCTSVGVFQAVKGDFFSSGAFQASGAALNANGLTNCFLSAILIGS